MTSAPLTGIDAVYAEIFRNSVLGSWGYHWPGDAPRVIEDKHTGEQRVSVALDPKSDHDKPCIAAVKRNVDQVLAAAEAAGLMNGPESPSP